jgi:hypothetical protein
MSETSHPLGKPAPLQLPVKRAVSYAGEKHFFNQRGKTLIFAVQASVFYPFYYISISNAILQG